MNGLRETTRRSLALIISILLVTSVPIAVDGLGGPDISPVSRAVADGSPTIDDFEDNDTNVETSGWSGWSGDTASFSTITTDSLAGDHSLNIQGGDKTAQVDADSNSQPTRIAARINFTGTSAGSSLFYVRDGTNTVFKVKFDSSNNIIYNAETDTGDNWRPNAIIEVEFRDIDWSSDTFDLYIDGEKIKNDAAFQTAADHLDRLRFDNAFSSSVDMRIDDVEVNGTAYDNSDPSDIFVEDFEDDDKTIRTDGWVGWQDGTSSLFLTNDSLHGEHSAVLDSDSDTVDLEAYSETGRVQTDRLEAVVNLSNTGGDGIFQVIDNDTSVMRILFDGSNRDVLYNSSSDSSLDFRPNVTYHIEFRDIDWSNDTYDVYVNGEQLAEDVSFQGSAAGFDQLKLTTTGTQNMTVDNIVVGKDAHENPTYSSGLTDDFEDNNLNVETDGWGFDWYATNSDRLSVTSDSIDGSYSGNVTAISENNVISIRPERRISPSEIKTKVKINTTLGDNSDGLEVKAVDDEGSALFRVVFEADSSQNVTVNDQVNDTGFVWSTGTTHTVRFADIDWSSHTFDIYIDGTQYVNDHAFETNKDQFSEFRLVAEAAGAGDSIGVTFDTVEAGKCTSNCDFSRQSTSGGSGNTVSGYVKNQNGDPVKNATVQVWGVDETQVSPDAGQTPEEAIQEEIQAAKNKTPEEWTTQIESDFHLTGTNGHFASQDTRYVAVHRLTDWKHSAITNSVKNDPTLQNPILSVDAARGETVTLALSVWDPDKFEIANTVSDVSNDLPGEPVEGQIVVETVVATDSVGTIQTTETVRDCGFVGCDWSEIFVEVELTPGFYRVYPKGDEGAAYFIKVGDPVEIIVDDLKNELNQLTSQASDTAQDVSSGLFVKKTTTTDASGSFSVDVGPNIKTVAIQAYKAEGIDVNDASQLDYQTIVEEYSDSFDPSTCTQNSQLGSVYLPSAVQTADPPATDVSVTVRELSFPSYSNLNSLACKSEDRLKQLLNETLTEALSMFQQRLEDLDTGELETIYNELTALYEQNQQLEERVDELLADRTGQDTVEVVVNESDASEQQLRDRIASLEEGISQLRSELEASVETEVGSDTISQIYSVQGDINPDAVTLLVHYSNGSTKTVTTDSEYLSVNKRPGLSDQVVLEEYPVGETDPATLTTELLVAEEETGAIGRVRDTVTNPHFDNAVPTLDSIAVSSLKPGPDEQVSIDIDPEDPTVFGSITDVIVIGPDGELTTDSISSNGQETGFRTNGAGLYHVKLTFNNSEGDTFVETFRLTAGDLDDARPASVQTRTGSTGRWLLVGDGLEGGTIDVGENGRQIAISAQISQGEDAPGSVHVYTHGIDTGAETVTTVKLTRGSNGESIQKQLGVVIHTDQLNENAILYREDPTNPLPRDGSNQHGVVDSRSNGTTIQTYTEGDGSVTVVTNTEPGTIEEIFYELRLQGVPLPSFATAGLLVAELANAAPPSAVASIGGPVAELVELLVDAAAPLTAAAAPTEATA